MTERDDTPETDGAPDAPPGMLVVGVGGSAGGLEAFNQLLENLPADAGMAVIFVLHLLPTRKSMLGELLSRKTTMPVVQAADGMPLEPNHVYAIPPDVYIEVAGGKLRLTSRSSEGGLFTPIDRLFASLAEEAGPRAVGVVLSGTGSDGAAGLRHIKEAGGMALAQTPGSAQRDEMPRAAALIGGADLILPPRELAGALAEIVRHPYVAAEGPPRARPESRPKDEDLQRVFALLRTASGVDFSHYKRPTIERRLMRRMALHRFTKVSQYLELLQKQPHEINLLYQDILIHVTFFFREPDSFKLLAEKAFPKLVEDRQASEPLRIWIPGCSSGEEPYSVAISLLEFLGARADETPIQIFATDISNAAIDLARAGLYTDHAVQPVPPDLLRRYFTPVDGKHRINKRVRDLCIFARHDLTRDPPFSRVDLVICRNVLIYIDQPLQKRLLSTFHYALTPGGFLMLGAAETVGLQNDLFSLVDKKHRLYAKRHGRPLPAEPLYGEGAYVAPPTVGVGKAAREHLQRKTVQQEANQLLLSKYAPPGVVLNEQFQIVQFRGQTGHFLEPAPGEVNLHVLKMVRPGLLHAVQTALREVRKSQAPVRKEGLHISFNGHGRNVNLEIIPLVVADEPPHYLMLFEDVTEQESAAGVRVAPPPPPDETSRDEELDQLRRELAASREYLQATIQDLEITNEELQSANEEVLSSNEELQSTNEELDTAKEELQSTNEELNTLNEELHSRNDELSRVNSDLFNLLGSVQLAVVMVDRALCVRRFTPAAEKLFNLISTDVGRPIGHIQPNINSTELEGWIRQVIDQVSPLERELQDREGNWFALRIRPYSGIDNRIEGAVLALLDVSAAKHRELDLQRAHEYTTAIVQAVREGLLVLDEGLRVQTVNRAFCRIFATTPEETVGRRVYDLGNHQWDIPGLRTLLEDGLPKSPEFDGFEVEHDFPRVGRKKVIVNARRIDAAPGRAALMLLAFEEARE
ncbi:MAG TPA: CheR family methyltransferase [Pirellulales bacterium]|nr:CheR family methyltransferase [Pirellulales bacterium]